MELVRIEYPNGQAYLLRNNPNRLREIGIVGDENGYLEAI